MYLIEPIRNGKYIDDGAVNLAMQVYINNNIFLDEDILLPYYCQPKVEIGRFQNTAVEINQDYVDENKIHPFMVISNASTALLFKRCII